MHRICILVSCTYIFYFIIYFRGLSSNIDKNAVGFADGISLIRHRIKKLQKLKTQFVFRVIGLGDYAVLLRGQSDLHERLLGVLFARRSDK